MSTFKFAVLFLVLLTGGDCKDKVCKVVDDEATMAVCLNCEFLRKNFYSCFGYKHALFRFGAHMSAVEKLQMRGGKGESLEFDRGEECPNLLDFSIGNAVDLTIVDLLNLPLGIEKLSFYDNEIKRLKNFRYIEKLTNLTKLDMSFNKLRGFSVKFLPKSVKVLALCGNLVTQINMKVLLDQMFSVNKFEKLDLRENPIDCHCEKFEANLETFDRTITSCDYVECFVCDWLKSRIFKFNELSNDLAFISENRHCVTT